MFHTIITKNLTIIVNMHVPYFTEVIFDMTWGRLKKLWKIIEWQKKWDVSFQIIIYTITFSFRLPI